MDFAKNKHRTDGTSSITDVCSAWSTVNTTTGVFEALTHHPPSRQSLNFNLHSLEALKLLFFLRLAQGCKYPTLEIIRFQEVNIQIIIVSDR